MKTIENLNVSELKEILKSLRKYSFMRKNLGKRWEKLFKRGLSDKPQLLVEFFPWISEELAYEKSFKAYEKVFNIKPNKEDIEFKKVGTMKWWIRVYFDDDMVDISYNRVENKIKNSLNY